MPPDLSQDRTNGMVWLTPKPFSMTVKGKEAEDIEPEKWEREEGGIRVKTDKADMRAGLRGSSSMSVLGR